MFKSMHTRGLQNFMGNNMLWGKKLHGFKNFCTEIKSANSVSTDSLKYPYRTWCLERGPCWRQKCTSPQGADSM